MHMHVNIIQRLGLIIAVIIIVYYVTFCFLFCLLRVQLQAVRVGREQQQKTSDENFLFGWILSMVLRPCRFSCPRS